MAPMLALLFLAAFGGADAGRISMDSKLETQDREAAQSACRNAVDPRIVQNNFGNMSAADKCHQCVGVSGCKWCPLHQECMASGFFGSSCPVRHGMEALDKKVKDAEECGVRGAAWETTLSESYGRGFLDNGRNEDAAKCARWALDWPLTDSGFIEEGPQYDTDGRWACVSALIREGVMAMTRRKTLPRYEGKAKSEHVEVWNPALCSLIKVKEYKDTCYVRGYALEEFEQLRMRDTAPNWRGPHDITSQLAESMAKGPIKSFNPGAGKSGSGFGSTADGKFKVKFGLKHTNKMDEVKNMMAMVLGQSSDPDATSLGDHLANNPKSMLNRQYALIKVAFGDIRTYVVVLADAFYHMYDAVKAEKKRGVRDIVSTAYDLKGASRNQKERSKGSTKMNGDFAIMEHNHMDLSDQQCLTMRSAMQADINFLTKYNIIDYSLLLLSVKRPWLQSSLTCRKTPGAPFCMENGDRMYTISLIDYLNNYNYFKKLESAVRLCKFCSYGNSVMTYLKRICRTREEQSFIEWINKVLTQRFGSARQAFQQVDEDGDGRLSERELDSLFQGIRLSPDNTDKLLAEVGKDESGSLSIEEFELALEVDYTQ